MPSAVFVSFVKPPTTMLPSLEKLLNDQTASTNVLLPKNSVAERQDEPAGTRLVLAAVAGNVQAGQYRRRLELIVAILTKNLEFIQLSSNRRPPRPQTTPDSSAQSSPKARRTLQRWSRMVRKSSTISLCVRAPC